jgi:hypothetical protein
MAARDIGLTGRLCKGLDCVVRTGAPVVERAANAVKYAAKQFLADRCLFYAVDGSTTIGGWSIHVGGRAGWLKSNYLGPRCQAINIIGGH